VKSENVPANFFTPPLKIGGENLKFRRLPPTSRQSEARNFETAQHVDKQKTDFSPTINALKTVPNLGASSHGVLMQPREKIDINDTQKCVFCPIAQNFLLIGPYTCSV